LKPEDKTGVAGMNFGKWITGTAFLLMAASSYPATADDLTVVSFGGAYGAAQKTHMIDPFVKETGTNILFEDYSGGVAEMTAQVESGNIQWDVVDIEAVDLERACSEGLLEVIPHDILLAGDDGTPAVEDFYPASLSNECGIGIMFWSLVFAYNTETIGDTVPATLSDFFDVEKIPGKRAIRKRPQGNLEWALIADGVEPDKVYEVLSTDEGQKRAFDKLASIKDNLVFYDSWSQAPQLLNDGDAVMVQSANGRIFNAIRDDGRPFKIVWDNNLFDQDVWSIVKGTPRLDLALNFVASATSTKAVAGMQDVAYGPSRRSSMPLIDPAIVDHLPTAHIDEGTKVDGLFWADYGDTLAEKFNQWLLSL
jgi:putative spermidine/putrescine transport system substrate-binding protein